MGYKALLNRDLTPNEKYYLYASHTRAIGEIGKQFKFIEEALRNNKLKLVSEAESALDKLRIDLANFRDTKEKELRENPINSAWILPILLGVGVAFQIGFLCFLLRKKTQTTQNQTQPKTQNSTQFGEIKDSIEPPEPEYIFELTKEFKDWAKSSWLPSIQDKKSNRYLTIWLGAKWLLKLSADKGKDIEISALSPFSDWKKIIFNPIRLIKFVKKYDVKYVNLIIYGDTKFYEENEGYIEDVERLLKSEGIIYTIRTSDVDLKKVGLPEWTFVKVEFKPLGVGKIQTTQV